MRVNLSGNDKRSEVAALGGDDGGPTSVCLVTDVGEGEDDDEGEGTAHGRQGVGWDRLPPEGPGKKCVSAGSQPSDPGLGHLHHDGGRIGRQGSPVGKDGKRRYKVWPATPMAYCFPHQGGRDVEPLSTGSLFLVVFFQPLLEDFSFRFREPDDAGAQERFRLIRRSGEEEDQHKGHEHREDALHWNICQLNTYSLLPPHLDLHKKIHCQPLKPPLSWSLRIPEAMSGLMALAPNMPKKRMATRLASSLFAYHVDSVYMAPGIYPDSQNPRTSREMRKPVRPLMKIWRDATMPKANTWPAIHFRGPICQRRQHLPVPRCSVWSPPFGEPCCRESQR